MMTRTLTAAWLLVLALAGAGQAAAMEFERGFEAAPGGRLEIDADAGSIRVETHDADRVDLRVEASGEGADRVQVETETRDDGLRVAVRIRDHRGAFEHLRVRILVAVPRTFDLDLDTAGGSIEVSELDGAVKADTAGGSILVERASGRVRVSTSGGSIEIGEGEGSIEADTSGGSIRVGRAHGRVDVDTSGGSIVVEESTGPVRADTSGGNVSVRAASGPVTASTSGGSIRVRFVGQPAGDSDLATAGGKVTVHIAPGLGFDIDAHSGGGVRSDFELEDARVSPRRLAGKLNGGGPRLEVDATGGIRIEASRD